MRVSVAILLLALGAARPSLASSQAPTTTAATTSSTASGATVGAAPELPAARYLVVVGYNGGAPDGPTPLQFADDDAARLFDQLTPTAERAWLLSTFDRESARLHPDLIDVAREPTRQGLAQSLGEAFWLMRQQHARGRRTELVFAFAGHGDVNDDGEGYVLLADGPFSRSDLGTQVIDASPADVNHIVIDACASYFMVRARGDESGRVELSPRLLDVLSADVHDAAARARTGVLVSTSSAAEVHESGELSAGVFSFLLRSALAGAADTDGDGDVEYAEAAAFIASSSTAIDDPRARLRIYAEAPLQRPHAPLIDLAHAGADRFLTVDERGPVHVRILDAHGLPYAEVHSTGERPVVLALVGAPFFVVQRGTQEALLVPRSAGAYALSTLSFEDAPRPRSSGSDVASRLFAAPFGPAFVAGYLASPQGTASLLLPEAGAAWTSTWARQGAPRARLALAPVGIGGLSVAVVLGLAAGGAAIGNQVAFSRLQAGFLSTGQLDPAQSLEVESWRTSATGLMAGALASGLVGGALLVAGGQVPDGEVVLPW